MLELAQRMPFGVRRSADGERRAGIGARRRPRPSRRDLPLLPSGDPALAATVVSCGHDLVTDPAYHWNDRQRGSDRWALLQYTISGSGRLAVGTIEHAVPSGTAMLLRMPGPHRYWLPDGGQWRFLWLSLRGPAVERAWAAAAALGPALQLGHRHPLTLLAARTVGELLATPAWTPWSVSARAYAVAMAVGELAGAAPTPVDADRLLEEWAREHLVERIGVDDLAAQAGCSRFHFTRRWQAQHGETPSALLARLRVERAVALLASADLPLSEIARRCGNVDASHLVRTFRRVHGCTPGVWRARLR